MTAHEEDHARVTGPMSAIGTKQTWASAPHMSAIGGKADIAKPAPILTALGKTRRRGWQCWQAILSISGSRSAVSRLHEVEAASDIRFRWRPFNARAIMPFSHCKCPLLTQSGRRPTAAEAYPPPLAC